MIILDCQLNEELKWGVPCYTFEKSFCDGRFTIARRSANILFNRIEPRVYSRPSLDPISAAYWGSSSPVTSDW
jgi:hypothetical protein